MEQMNLLMIPKKLPDNDSDKVLHSVEKSKKKKKLEVSEILGEKLVDNEIKYHVSVNGNPFFKTTWLSAQQISNFDEEMQKYYDKSSFFKNSPPVKQIIIEDTDESNKESNKKSKTKAKKSKKSSKKTKEPRPIHEAGEKKKLDLKFENPLMMKCKKKVSKKEIKELTKEFHKVFKVGEITSRANSNNQA